MKKHYTSSLINKYGDREKVPQDVRTIFEIHDRQGSSLLIDCLAEKAGSAANKMNLSARDRETLIDNLICELQDALRERL